MNGPEARQAGTSKAGANSQRETSPSRGKGVNRDAEQRRIAALRTQRAALVLVLLALAATAWAGYLWHQLIEARSAGAAPVCAFGDADCGALWDAEFATWVRANTGLPVAAWGVVWGIAALLMSLGLWWARQRTDPKKATLPLNATWNGAVHVMATLGAVSILLLAAASAFAGLFCSSCVVTYVTVLAFATVCFFGLPSPGSTGLAQGFGVAALSTMAVALLLLLLGPETPPKLTDSLDGVELNTTTSRSGRETPDARTDGEERLQSQPTSSPNEQPAAAATDSVASFLASLPPQAIQSISDTLEAYRQAPVIQVPAPRALIGDPAAPVRMTIFTDTLCSHCATLHQTLEQLLMMAPNRFSIDSRHYPLDGGCNPHIGGQESAPGVRCTAALVRICAENSEHRMEVENRLYAQQRRLDQSNLYDFVAPPLERMLLDTCIGADRAAASLAEDIETAWQLSPHGTPLVVVNGKQALFYPPLLLALILTDGDVDHPDFSALPAPQPLPDAHEGHDH